MTLSPPAAGQELEAGEAFYSRVFRRIVVMMALLAFLLTPVVWIRFHRRTAVSFAAGALIAMLNFYWLALTVRAFGTRAEASGGRRGSAGIVARFMLRYLLIALAAYVIFNGSNSLYGLFAGLSLPVAAIMMEAVLEIYSALRAGI